LTAKFQRHEASRGLVATRDYIGTV